MNATYIVTSYVVIDDILELIGHTDDARARVSSAEIVTVAIVAAKYFQNHHERVLCLLQPTTWVAASATPSGRPHRSTTRSTSR